MFSIKRAKPFISQVVTSWSTACGWAVLTGKMEAVMWHEKENGDLCLPSKTNCPTVPQLNKGTLQMVNAKSFTVAKPRALRKALGNINQVQTRKPASSKVAKNSNLKKEKCAEYPEIDTFIPYNPLDYETFDVPEEHKLSDRCLAGLPLFVSKDDAERFAALHNPVFSPMETEPIKYDSIATSIPLFDDITIDLPVLCYF
ncbi:securin-like [Ranitomeya variabilis]|uniref:securin-like n=1 Tax=Ranitomeya variabilis TaxID=490064 RepID=UPI004055F22C